MIITELQIENLTTQIPITDEWPWSTNDESTIDEHIKGIIAEVRRKARVLDKTEYGHYGSGYASYIDCWLYREDEEFRFTTGDCYWGLVVLFSRLSNYYVIGEGQKAWHSRGASSYLPCFEFVDQINQPSTKGILGSVFDVLDQHGLVRLSSEELSTVLPKEIRVPTILADPPWQLFDAIFYWED